MKKSFLIPLIIIVVGAGLVLYSLLQHRSLATSERALNLSEFGIALTIPGTLNDLSYIANNATSGPGTMLRMRIKETCEIGAFYEIQKNAISKSGTPWTEETLEQFQQPIGANPARVKEFTDFYLVFEPSQEPCSSNEKAAQEESAQRLALWNSLVTARYMSY